MAKVIDYFKSKTILKIAMVYAIAIFSIKPNIYAQNLEAADSLKILLTEDDTLSSTNKLIILSNLSQLCSSPEDVLTYSKRLLRSAHDHKQTNYVVKAYQYQGVAYRMKGNLKESLKQLIKSAELAKENHYLQLQAEAYLEIANTYTANSQFKNSLLYEKKAIEILRKDGDIKKLAINLLNTGYSYYTLNYLDSSLALYNEAEPLFDTTGLTIGKAYVIGNRALVYWQQGDDQTAERDLLKAIDMLEPLGDQFGMSDYHNQLGRLYAERNDITSSINHTNAALQIAKALDLKEQIRDASLLLSQLYEEQQDYTQAFTYQTQYITYKDSIENTETTKKMADLRTEFEVNQKEKEIAILEKSQLMNRTYIIIAVFLLALAILLILYFRQRLHNTRLMSANERKQHDEKIKKLLNTQETKALQSMVEGKDQERKRLAQELHNHFGSLLATIKVNINGIEEESIPNHYTLTTLVDQACNDIRNMSHSLNMGISENFGLVSALKELSEHLRQSGDLEVEFSASMCGHALAADEEITIYRIVQELVSNVLKHSHATKLSILLTCFEEEQIMNIMVQDNGRGFDTKNKPKSGGIGVETLNKMVADKQGDIKFDSNTISGTTVIIDLPLSYENIEEL
ncbi:hypothetical protein BGP76_08095 [Reichenbachiella sp. MSK19-1]|nr:hypothetical protein BGP76_08095 [Reichenbachiella sp. MSK19-1]